jgi:hypothetical protein
LEPGAYSQADFNRIASKHVDFLLCDKHSMRPVLVLELNDRSHTRSKGLERDEHTKVWLKTAGIPFLQIPAARSYNAIELRTVIASALAGAVYVPSPTEQKLEVNQNSAASTTSSLQPDRKLTRGDTVVLAKLDSQANTASSL